MGRASSDAVGREYEGVNGGVDATRNNCNDYDEKFIIFVYIIFVFATFFFICIVFQFKIFYLYALYFYLYHLYTNLFFSTFLSSF